MQFHILYPKIVMVYDFPGSPKIVFVFLGLLILTEVLLSDIYRFLLINEIYLDFNITIKYIIVNYCILRRSIG
ncbi:MAG: hypothetical protein CM1200mP5_4510 [Candidatus Pelagibacterales bacterium]|nr:MAG: hypothetical protein CM1200mP5_4510 [Pelagibacterales bacterium]